MKNRFLSVAILALGLTACDTLNKVATVAKAINMVPTTEETIQGLKEALKNGVQGGVNVLSQAGSFYKNDAIKVLFPPEVANFESKLRNWGLGGEVDKAVKALNDGAESAMGKAMPIFFDAITNMTVEDAMGILKGGNSAATNYLKRTTTALTSAFKPVIQNALDEVGATKYYTDLVSVYNKLNIGGEKINPDLNSYVTEKAMGALFSKIEEEENAIRSNPAKRTSDILKKVFDYADSQKG